MTRPHRLQGGIGRDLGTIALSVLVAVLLIQTHALDYVFASTEGVAFISAYVAGFFFTSIFTTAPAIAALGEIARVDSIFLTALFGALGAMCGDYFIFWFIRDRFSEHIKSLVRLPGAFARVRHLFKLKIFRWLTFLFGGLIIASPLPDELGLSLLGFSKTRTSWFLPLSFGFNFIGIVLIGLAARALS